MAKTRVFIVHDELGNISSVSRPTEHDRIKVVVLSGQGEAVLQTELDEDAIQGAVHTHRVDVGRQTVIKKQSGRTK